MKLVLKDKKPEVGSIISLYFESDDMPTWQPGQYLNLSMPGVPLVYADRLFSIASAPHDSLLQFTTIIGTSPFKQRLDSLALGEEIEADQLGGDFTWVEDDHDKLFIAGGIGITPYMSIIRDRLHRRLPINSLLLYAGKDDRRPFVEELKLATLLDPTLKIQSYASVRLTLEKLLNDVPDVHERIVYLAGSQVFSETLGEGLIARGHKRSRIKYDYFDGYVDIEY